MEPKLRFNGYVDSWKEKKLSKLANITMGQSPSSKYYNNNKEGLPLIQGNADISDRKTSPRVYTTEITKICNVGDIIMSVRAPVGTVSKSLHHACIGRGVCSIKANMSSNLLYQILLKQEPRWGRLSTGTTFDSINSADIKNSIFAIPGAEEEHKLTDFFNLIDKKIDIQKKAVESLEENKKGLMQKIFSQEIRFKDENGEEFPEWKKYALKDFIKKRFKGKLPKYATDGNLLLNNKYLENNGEKLYVSNPIDTYEDDVMLLWDGSIGNVYTGVEGVAGSTFVVLKMKDNFNNYFLTYFMSHNQKEIVTKWQEGSMVPHLARNFFELFEIDTPSLPEQESIVEFINLINNKIKIEKEILESLKELKKGFLQQMLI